MAIETQTPIKPLLFEYIRQDALFKYFSLNPGISKTIFLEEIPVTGLTYKDVAALKQKVYDMMGGVIY